MTQRSYRDIEELLASSKPEEIRRGLLLAKNEISRIGAGEARALFEIVSTIFHIDPLDRPDLVPVLDEAISLVVGLGKRIIPVLVEQLDAGDLKAQMAVAQTLGRIGDEAIEPLIAAYGTTTDPARRAFVLYALGKIKSPNISRAARLALEAAQSPDLELRDTAARAIGKFAESIPPSRLPEDIRKGFIGELQRNLGTPNPGVRAKAVRSLGKLARYGHLTVEEQQRLRTTCLLLLGREENYEWDRAYVVRKEAEEALTYLKDK